MPNAAVIPLPSSPAWSNRPQVAPPLHLDARQLAELVLVGALRPGINLVVLQRDGESYALLLKSGGHTRARYSVDAEIANAAAARLALTARVDPFSLADPMGGGNAARVRVRLGDDLGEVLVCIGLSGSGDLDVEARPLGWNGEAPSTERQPSPLKRCARCGSYQAATDVICDRDGSPLVEVYDDPRPGGTVGAYAIREHIGQGGMGSVLAAEHALLGREFAVKLLDEKIAKDPVMARRFLAEARAASRIRHPNVVEVTDFGVLAHGRPYLVMERLSGVTLESVLDASHTLPPETALRITREILIGLGAAHEAGVVHHDLKPANVVLLDGTTSAQPRLKIVDFGAACFAGQPYDEELGLIGTPAYMAPQQVRAEPADLRNDIYSLGIILYEMLVGNTPFSGDNPTDIMTAHLKSEPPPMVVGGEALPPALCRLVLRALRKNAEARFQSVGEMLAELDRTLTTLRQPDWRRWLP